MKAEFFTNRQLGKLETKNILALGTEDDPIRFVIIGELSSEGQYKNSALAIRAKSLFVLDPHSGEVFETVDFDDIGEIVAKRMYSNAFLRIRLTNEGKFKNIFRYSLKLSALCDCVVSYVNAYKAGESLESRLEAVHDAYDKQLLVCPQCGRSLSAPGVKCINCQGKRQTIARLAK